MIKKKELIKTSVWTLLMAHLLEYWLSTQSLREAWRRIRVCRLPGLEFSVLSRFFSAALHCLKLSVRDQAKPGWSTAGWSPSEWFPRFRACDNQALQLFVTNCLSQLSVCLSLLCCPICHFCSCAAAQEGEQAADGLGLLQTQMLCSQGLPGMPQHLHLQSPSQTRGCCCHCLPWY